MWQLLPGEKGHLHQKRHALVNSLPWSNSWEYALNWVPPDDAEENENQSIKHRWQKIRKRPKIYKYKTKNMTRRNEKKKLKGAVLCVQRIKQHRKMLYLAMLLRKAK